MYNSKRNAASAKWLILYSECCDGWLARSDETRLGMIQSRLGNWACIDEICGFSSKENRSDGA